MVGQTEQKITAATEPAETKPSGAAFAKLNSPSYSSQYICYPSKEGEWKNFKLTVCPKCLRNTASEPDHNRETCSNDMSSDAFQPCSEQHKATMPPTYRREAVAAAMAVEPSKRAATYLKKNKELLDTEINAGGPPTKGTHTDKISDTIWREDAPSPIPNMVQLELSDLKIKINLKDYTKQTGSQMSAESEEYPVRAKAVLEMLFPPKNEDENHKWEIDAKCFGMHLVVHNANGDKMEQSRCSFLHHQPPSPA